MLLSVGSTVRPIVFFGKVWRIASEEVVIHLIRTKCVPILLYGLEALPLNKSQLASLDFVVNRFFMKLFKTTDMHVVIMCREHFDFVLPSLQLDRLLSSKDLVYVVCLLSSEDLVYVVAEAIGTEARAVFNNASRNGDFSPMKGISCFAPFVNVMRHPLWGRVQVLTSSSSHR